MEKYRNSNAMMITMKARSTHNNLYSIVMYCWLNATNLWYHNGEVQKQQYSDDHDESSQYPHPLVVPNLAASLVACVISRAAVIHQLSPSIYVPDVHWAHLEDQDTKTKIKADL